MSEQQKKGRLGEVIRFVVTGGVCFLIEQAVLSLLKEIFGLDVNIGTPIAFLVSVVANYLLCVKWVFPGAGGSGACDLIREIRQVSVSYSSSARSFILRMAASLLTILVSMGSDIF